MDPATRQLVASVLEHEIVEIVKYCDRQKIGCEKHLVERVAIA